MHVVNAARSFVVAGVRAAAGVVDEKAMVATTARAATPICAEIEGLPAPVPAAVLSLMNRMSAPYVLVGAVVFAFRVLTATLRPQ